MTLQLYTDTMTGVLAHKVQRFPFKPDGTGQDMTAPHELRLQLQIGSAHAQLTKEQAGALSKYLADFAESE